MFERRYTAKVLNRAEPQRKPREFQWRRYARLALIIAAIAVIIVLIRLPMLQIRSVEVVGTSVEDPDDVIRFITDQISGDFIFILPKKSMLLVPTATLGKRLARAYPRLSSVDVRRKGASGLIVTVQEHEGKYLWCENDGACYFMDDAGLAFAPAPYFSGDAYLKIFGGTAGQLPFVPLPEVWQALVPMLPASLEGMGINVNEFHFESEHQLSLLFKHNGAPARLVVDPTSDMSAAMDALYTALHTKPLSDEFASRSRVLEYIDLRFANKVVYRFQ